ncbi:hypothetical protein [Clostridium tertium]|uniref:hypothetical protein n=1 Tax=Clostridium tertium TaxID=1559 RepID=UPI0024B3A5C1|nr:hypothetical protein [Clostridium tertium]MDI9218134.1 hypothetical protein [Clostridium tertium]
MGYKVKIRKHFTISSKSINYINKVKEEKNYKSESETLEKILKEHEEKAQTTTELMIKIIANEVAKELKNELKNIIIGVNSTDKHSQILIEMLNGLFIKNDVREILTSDIVKSEGLEIAENSVKKRIRKNRIRKLNNE